MSIIKESFLLVADNTDILVAPSRLAAIPAAGVLTIEASAGDCDVSNFGRITLQLPGGEIPFEDLHVPFSGIASDGMLDSNTELIFVIPVAAGGHVLYQYDETGTVGVFFTMVTLEF